MNKPAHSPAALEACQTPPSPDLAAQIPARRAYPVDEARALLGGISRKSIYDLINDGSLGTVMFSGRRLVPADAIDSLIAASRAAPPRPVAAQAAAA